MGNNKKNSPESGRPVEELSLRERLAMKANVSVDKMPTNTNTLYNTFGNGKQNSATYSSITSMIGSKRPRDDDEYDLNMGDSNSKPRDVRGRLNRVQVPSEGPSTKKPT